jgi:hypothetical protein
MEDWMCFKIALKHCLSHNGLIYGGAVRDLMLHNNHSKEFFKTHRFEDYTDETLSPETLGRLVIPNDIDCLISERDSKALIEYFSHQYFVRVKEVKNVYFNNNSYKHLKVCVLFHVTSIIYVKIDLIVQQIEGDLKMPCNNLDFDVNGLVLHSGGFGLNEFLLKGHAILNAETLQDVLDNIRQKKAIAIDGCRPYRFDKMHGYGWNILFCSTIFNYYIGQPYDGDCIICKEKIPDDMCCVNYKKCTCDLRVCLKCMLMHHEQLNKCPLCTEICYSQSDALRELNILKIKHPIIVD